MKQLYSTIILVFVISLTTTVARAQFVSDVQKQKFDILFFDAINARTMQDYGASFDLLNYCYAIDSTNTSVAYELGNFYKTLKNTDKAYAMYEKAYKGFPDNYYYGASYAAMALQLGKLDEAIECLSSLVEKHPSYTNLYFYLSGAYKGNKNYQGAIDALTKAEEFVGLNEQISLEKYELYKLLGEEKRAFAEIEKYIEKYPKESDYYVLMGDLYMQTDKPEEAKKYYEQAKALNPDNPYIVVSLASYYDKMNQRDLADEELRRAIVSHNMDVDTKMSILAQDIASMQEKEASTESFNVLFDTLMILHPQEPKLNLLYGNLLILQDNKTKAREQYRIFAEANPSNPYGWEQLLMTTYPDSLDLTIAICKEAITYLPNEPQFYFYAGISEYLNKDYKAALNALLTGKNYVSEDNPRLASDFYGQIGDLYHYIGQIDSAYIAYDVALKLNPGNIGVLNNYSYFLSQENKQLNKAERMSGITIKAEPLNPTYLDTYGWVMFKQGAYELSKTYIEKAIEYSKDKEEISSEVYEHYGDVLYKTGDAENAMVYWLKAKDALEEGEEKKTLIKKIEKGEYIEANEANDK